MAWLLIAYCSYAQDTAFPPISGLERYQHSLLQDDGIDISNGGNFSVLTTFASLLSLCLPENGQLLAGGMIDIPAPAWHQIAR